MGRGAEVGVEVAVATKYIIQGRQFKVEITYRYRGVNE
jgi:hypothetical protein